jgi:hypothetical protein
LVNWWVVGFSASSGQDTIAPSCTVISSCFRRSSRVVLAASAPVSVGKFPHRQRGCHRIFRSRAHRRSVNSTVRGRGHPRGAPHLFGPSTSTDSTGLPVHTEPRTPHSRISVAVTVDIGVSAL